MLPSTEPMIVALATLIRPAFTVRIEDDQLGRVAEGRVQQGGEAGGAALTRLLGRLAEHVCEPGDRDARGDEDQRRGSRRWRAAPSATRARAVTMPKAMRVVAREATGLSGRCADGHEGTLS